MPDICPDAGPQLVAIRPNYAQSDGIDTTLMTEAEIELYNKVAHAAHMYNVGAMRDDLVALVEAGPLFDGDVPSKAGRNLLIQKGLAVRVMVKGEDGYTAANYFGAAVYKYIYGKSSTIAEAKAFRTTQRALRNASNQG